MKRKAPKQPTGEFTLRLRDWRGRWSDRIVALFSLAVPLFVVIGAKDTFRLPKDALFRAEAILLASLYVAAAIVRAPRELRIEWKRLEIAVPLIALLWMALATLASTNRGRSLDSLVTACAAAIIFFATIEFAKRRGFKTLFFILIPAVINAIVGALQEFDIWQPFHAPPEVTHHQRSTALIGNPNDAGSYLAAAALAAVVAAIASREYRKPFGVAAAILMVGLLINQTLTAIVACGVAALVAFCIRSWKRALVAAIAALLIVAIAVVVFPPLRQRANNMRNWMHAGNYNAALTNRGTPFIAAALMARDHLLTGVGPGAFAWQYFPYKIEAEKRVPSLRHSYTRGTNYSEVHNDHLQVLAETGVPGYAIFIATIVALATLSRRRPSAVADDRSKFTRLLALPLAVEFFVLALAQFPLEITAVLSQFIFLAALCAAWVEG